VQARALNIGNDPNRACSLRSQGPACGEDLSPQTREIIGISAHRNRQLRKSG
jgi:hypothetical protein